MATAAASVSLSRTNSETMGSALPAHLFPHASTPSLPLTSTAPVIPAPPSPASALSSNSNLLLSTPTHGTSSLAHSPSASSTTSSIISRQSSCRSTASVVATPFKTPVRGIKSNGGGGGRGGGSVGAGGDYFGICNPRNGGADAELGTEVSTPDSTTTYGSSATVSIGRRGVGGTMDDQTNGHGNGNGIASLSSEKSVLSKAGVRPGMNEKADSNGALRKGTEDFKFGEILGEGSYSTVTQVTSIHPPYRSYALKVLDKEHIKREKKIKYVLIERDTLKILDGHPGIVRLFWTFQDARSLYYVLELAENGELLKWIKRFGSFSLPSARYYAAQILSAVEYMHSKGVIHRDLKPENILLSADMKVKITDFGTAKVCNQEDEEEVLDDGTKRSRRRSFVGTPEYVSPEILSEKKESSRSSDFWAFGCILYQILAGHPPFQARTEYLTFQKIIKLEYEFPEGFPAEARDLIERLLVLDPEERLGGDAIKSHPFFTMAPAIDFSAIWESETPTIETGLRQPRKEERGEFVLVDELDYDNDEDDEENEDSRRGGDDATEVINGRSMVERRNEPITKWSNLLSPRELILLSSSIIDRTQFSLLAKRRTLILTNYPRLLCIKESSERVTVKHEILLVCGGVFESVEREGERLLIVKTRNARYKFEELSGSLSADRWIQEIRSAAERI